MTPPDDSSEAEIYIEGKRRMVEGFVRWCSKGDVGLSQVITVKEVVDEEPTGMYDEFYVKSG
jgi:acylphosphatase